MPPSAVVDASVLVSAYLFPESVPVRVLSLAADGSFAMHLSPLLVEETRRSLLSARLRTRYGHEEDHVLRWCAGLGRIGTMFPGALPDVGQICHDPDDDHVIAAAVAIRAHIIVTGDVDLFALRHVHAIRIVTPRDFLAEIGPHAG
jgi:putative PIN family toxin of toxin-antitoxin system